MTDKRQIHISHQFVEFIPERLDEGVLYISKRYGTAIHKCCCGCGEEVVTPLNPTDWSLRMDGNFVTLEPSIGNWSYACRSHYWIRRSKVIWAGQMSQHRIERGRAINSVKKQVYFKEINRKKTLSSKLSSNVTFSQNEDPWMPYVLWRALKRWWNSLKE